MSFKNELDKTTIIINVLTANFGADDMKVNKRLKNKENKYMLLLLLKNYKCLDKDKVKEVLEIISDKSINYNLNKAEEKLLINKAFREMYFELEEKLNEII